MKDACVNSSGHGLSRRDFVAAAIALGATPALAHPAGRSSSGWREDRAAYPQGVASGDPSPDGMILWTRREHTKGLVRSRRLTVEVSEDAEFNRVVVARTTVARAEADWTCRVLVRGLLPSRDYWYRFTDELGSGSRAGRTRTAPDDGDDRSVRFAFVSCQNITLGPLTAWRRMVFDDQATAPADQLEFVLHLGDFVYDTVWYPADRPNGYFDRAPNDLVQYPTGEKHDDYHVPANLEDYRTLYKAYLEDPDLQNVRARWPFIAIWDNGEFSDKGWQSLQRFGSTTVPAQSRKVAANQAWFEYLPARVRTAGGSIEAFHGPEVRDAPVTHFDRDGLGIEPNNQAALASLTGYRAQRWGSNVELVLTDQRSYRSDDFSSSPGSRTISSKTFPQMVPIETLEGIDAGCTWDDNRPAEDLLFADGRVPNFQKGVAPRTILGAKQKAWFLDRLGKSTATWKMWGNTLATFDMRADPQHLPPGLTTPWPGAGYAGFPRTDYSTAYSERGEILDFVIRSRVTGFVTLSGDRHSFWAGYTAKALPPQAFEPVGLNFVTGSISSPGMVEAMEYSLPKTHPLRGLYLVDRDGRSKPEPTVNLLLKHGVRTSLDYESHGNLAQAVALSDPGNAPHVEFVDMGGHGYGVVTASKSTLDVEFVCIPRPVVQTPRADGGELRYRVVMHAELWQPGERPKLYRASSTGDTGLST
ncbi:phosphodiesterase [Sphingomonas koreensis]|nr:phosphodiesterase [Sphingomonas koreensis]